MPMTAVAKISAKGQTTIPAEVRAALRVGPGDLIAWELHDDGSARIRRVQPTDTEYLKAVAGTLSEWSSPADEAAYRGL
jgi:AbrB family looped-hinge helix DNA binding protein